MSKSGSKSKHQSQGDGLLSARSFTSSLVSSNHTTHSTNKPDQYWDTNPLPIYEPASQFDYFAPQPPAANPLHLPFNQSKAFFTGKNKKKKLKLRKLIAAAAVNDECNYFRAECEYELNHLTEKQQGRLLKNIIDYIRFYCTLVKERFQIRDVEDLFAHTAIIPTVHLTQDDYNKVGLLQSLEAQFTSTNIKPIQWFDIITSWKPGFQQVMTYQEFRLGLHRFCDEKSLAMWESEDIDLMFSYFLRSETFPLIRRHDFRVGWKKLKLSKRRKLWLNHQGNIIRKLQHFMKRLNSTMRDFCAAVVLNPEKSLISLAEVTSAVSVIISDYLIFAKTKHRNQLVNLYFPSPEKQKKVPALHSNDDNESVGSRNQIEVGDDISTTSLMDDLSVNSATTNTVSWVKTKANERARLVPVEESEAGEKATPTLLSVSPSPNPNHDIGRKHLTLSLEEQDGSESLGMRSPLPIIGGGNIENSTVTPNTVTTVTNVDSAISNPVDFINIEKEGSKKAIEDAKETTEVVHEEEYWNDDDEDLFGFHHITMASKGKSNSNLGRNTHGNTVTSVSPLYRAAVNSKVRRNTEQLNPAMVTNLLLDEEKSQLNDLVKSLGLQTGASSSKSSFIEASRRSTSALATRQSVINRYTLLKVNPSISVAQRQSSFMMQRKDSSASGSSTPSRETGSRSNSSAFLSLSPKNIKELQRQELQQQLQAQEAERLQKEYETFESSMAAAQEQKMQTQYKNITETFDRRVAVAKAKLQANR